MSNLSLFGTGQKNFETDLLAKRPKFTLFLDDFSLNPMVSFGIVVQIYQ